MLVPGFVGRLFLTALAIAGIALAETGRFVDAIARVQPAVVRITTDKLRARRPAGQFPLVQVRSAGTGFIFDTSGHILTCNHVISGYEEILVELHDGTEYKGEEVRVVGRDPVTDLAVLQVRTRGLPAPAELGNSDVLDIGQWVIALGSPFGLQGSAAAGVVSGLSRWGLAKRSGPDFQDFIQTDALVNPGNSGGPLVDLQGRVLGVNSFIRTTRSGPTGIGFATPINLAKAVAEQLIRDGRVTRGFLGISTQPITEGIRQALGLQSRDGVLVASVDPDRPGDNAGIVPGDAIVTIDGKPIPDARWFQSEVADRSPGATVALGLVRRGQKKLVNATLGSWTIPVQPGPKIFTAQHWLGLVVKDGRGAEPRPGEPDYGIVITELEGGPGAEAGLRPGDIINEINLAPVRSVADFERIEKVMAGTKRPLLLRVFRGRQTFYTTVQP